MYLKILISRGGVAVTYRDENSVFEKIGTFVMFKELQSILKKVSSLSSESLSEIIFTQNKFNLDILYKDHPEYLKESWTKRKDKRLDKPIFSRVDAFTIEPTTKKYYKVIGIHKLKREWRYIDEKYIDKSHENLFKWKVILPVSNGSGALGEVLSTPLIGEPLIGYTRSFIGIGAFDNEIEARSLFKYIKTKFARVMLGILKITQDNTAEKWKYVPLQDFTSNSDIDWTKSIHEIDEQLYKKYNLSEEEIEFIETKVKEMG